MNIQDLTKGAEERSIPLRTLDDVRATLERDAARDPAIAEAMASLMLKAGRLTSEAREFVAAWK